MPLYEYECERCGRFTELRPMSMAAEPCDCPSCARAAPRIISAPRLACMSSENRRAWERNERSAHAPRVSKRSGCGCSGAHVCGTDQKPTTVASKPHARPWMLGH